MGCRRSIKLLIRATNCSKWTVFRKDILYHCINRSYCLIVCLKIITGNGNENWASCVALETEYAAHVWRITIGFWIGYINLTISYTCYSFWKNQGHIPHLYKMVDCKMPNVNQTNNSWYIIYREEKKKTKSLAHWMKYEQMHFKMRT